MFTDSPLTMLEAEADHRRHAIIEQVIADLNPGPLAHLPSGKFTANSAWLVLAAAALNLTRAAGILASALHAKATTATIRRQLTGVAAPTWQRELTTNQLSVKCASPVYRLSKLSSTHGQWAEPGTTNPVS